MWEEELGVGAQRRVEVINQLINQRSAFLVVRDYLTTQQEALCVLQ